MMVPSDKALENKNNKNSGYHEFVCISLSWLKLKHLESSGKPQQILKVKKIQIRKIQTN